MNKTYKGIITAETPLHHGGNVKTGSQSMLRRIKYYVNGKFIEIPYISGNAIRGRLRRLVFDDLLALIDYKIENLRLHHVLFSGGTLTSVSSKDTGTIDFEMRREIHEYIPMLSLFGTAVGNQIMPGKIIIGNMIPICKELNEILGTKSEHSIHEFLDWSHQTRKDDLHLEREKGEQAQQMLYEFEVFIPGTQFKHTFVLEQPDDVEISAFGRIMKLFKESPFVGAMKAVGLARLKLQYEDLPSDELYLQFLSENKERITEVLKGLEEKV